MTAWRTVQVRGVTLGEGIPKIIVPIVAERADNILTAARKLDRSTADIVEWRADHFAQVSDEGAVTALLAKLREALGEIPLLFTFRTADEGGARALPADAYEGLLTRAMESGTVDLLDVELFRGEELVRRLIGCAHAHGVSVIVSNHEFFHTPAKEELLARLDRMQALGADVLKLACMPQNAADVLTLLAATEERARSEGTQPLITMAMGELGVLSRIGGEVFGSAATFGTVGAASAPGQLEAAKLRELLMLLHKQTEM